jgi:hypothetical protein
MFPIATARALVNLLYLRYLSLRLSIIWQVNLLMSLATSLASFGTTCPRLLRACRPQLFRPLCLALYL